MKYRDYLLKTYERKLDTFSKASKLNNSIITSIVNDVNRKLTSKITINSSLIEEGYYTSRYTVSHKTVHHILTYYFRNREVSTYNKKLRKLLQLDPIYN